MNKSPVSLPYLRPFMLFVALILVIGSVGLFFVPQLVVPRWPWTLAPFHARFLGAVYSAEMAAVLIVIGVNRWAPARLTVPVAVVFTLVVSLASLLHLDAFDFSRRVVWLWFFLYIVSFVVTAVLWRTYQQPAQNARPTSPLWQTIFLAETAVYGLYGLAMFLIPTQATAFWPWPIDAFHASVYSAVFFSAAASAWILRREAAPIEQLTLGLSQLILGSFAIIGLVIVDAQVNRIDWSAANVWVWIGFWLVLVALGGGLLLQARRTRQLSTGTTAAV